MNFKNREGMKIKYDRGDGVFEGTVTGYDWNIGITIMDDNSIQDHFLCCINGKHSPNNTVKRYKDKFRFITKAIDEGVLINYEYIKEFHKNGTHGFSPTSSSCAFNQ